jgi:hypothetical protein
MRLLEICYPQSLQRFSIVNLVEGLLGSKLSSKLIRDMVLLGIVTFLVFQFLDGSIKGHLYINFI